MEPDPETEANAPDWSNEPASDRVLASALREKLRQRIEDRRERRAIERLIERLRELGFGD